MDKDSSALQVRYGFTTYCSGDEFYALGKAGLGQTKVGQANIERGMLIRCLRLPRNLSTTRFWEKLLVLDKHRDGMSIGLHRKWVWDSESPYLLLTHRICHHSKDRYQIYQKAQRRANV